MKPCHYHEKATPYLENDVLIYPISLPTAAYTQRVFSSVKLRCFGYL